MCSLCVSGPYILTATLLTATLSLQVHAQSPQIKPATTPAPIRTTSPASATLSTAQGNIAANRFPEAPGSHIATQPPANPPAGSISGAVVDTNGDEVPGALVALENNDSRVQRTSTTDSAGSFKFDAVEPGKFTLTITSVGFAAWGSTDLALDPGESYQLPPVALRIAPAMTEVEVNFTKHDIAEEQIAYAEKQRVLGVFPNFYASYVRDAAPLSAGQKYRLAWRTMIDPVTIAIPAVIAGVEQGQNAFSGYGQGVQGYAKRFGASYTDSFTSTMLGDAVLPSILHQDPRYFYNGTGSIRSRALYAIATAVICKGDNGHWQPNYSNLMGNLASAGISNLYYPSTNRNSAQLTIDNWLIGTASGAVGALFQEFLVKKLSHGVQPETGP
jgi:Carboxypeptidase regulatory-like domain